ncbi:hypothetical protein JAAARDRAFT_63557 [Jaapia argillacea MUCL 33604]|uniref:Uncharacterized protein n=1 Tax=Jaapia argillacea MUCL 33604 TaxID=933084 RepID=A0A067P4J2_9AGAM|nr:hypothetical protein JAAARDRAFT_63557 [Jaapia argillacea MUCL 33604]
MENSIRSNGTVYKVPRKFAEVWVEITVPPPKRTRPTPSRLRPLPRITTLPLRRPPPRPLSPLPPIASSSKVLLEDLPTVEWDDDDDSDVVEIKRTHIPLHGSEEEGPRLVDPLEVDPEVEEWRSGGDYIVTWGKNRDKPIYQCDKDWLHRALESSRLIHGPEFKLAASRYIRYLSKYPGACVIPFSSKYLGVRLENLRDLPFLEHCVESSQIQKTFPHWQKAAQHWLEIRPKRIEVAHRDIGQRLTKADDAVPQDESIAESDSIWSFVTRDPEGSEGDVPRSGVVDGSVTSEELAQRSDKAGDYTSSSSSSSSVGDSEEERERFRYRYRKRQKRRVRPLATRDEDVSNYLAADEYEAQLHDLADFIIDDDDTEAAPDEDVSESSVSPPRIQSDSDEEESAVTTSRNVTPTGDSGSETSAKSTEREDGNRDVVTDDEGTDDDGASSGDYVPERSFQLVTPSPSPTKSSRLRSSRSSHASSSSNHPPHLYNLRSQAKRASSSSNMQSRRHDTSSSSVSSRIASPVVEVDEESSGVDEDYLMEQLLTQRRSRSPSLGEARRSRSPSLGDARRSRSPSLGEPRRPTSPLDPSIYPTPSSPPPEEVEKQLATQRRSKSPSLGPPSPPRRPTEQQATPPASTRTRQSDEEDGARPLKRLRRYDGSVGRLTPPLTNRPKRRIMLID